MRSAIFSQERPTLGAVFSTSFRILGQQFVPLMVLGLVAYLPLLLIQYLPGDPTSITRIGLACVFLLAWCFTFPIGYGAAFHGVFQAAMGRPIDVGQSLASGAKRFGRTLGVAFLSFLLIGLGTLLFIIPGVIVALRLYLSLQVAAVESTGVTESLKRSTTLTEGFRAMCFGSSLIVGLLNMAIQLVPLAFAEAQAAVLLWNAGAMLVTGTLSIVVSGVLYFMIRAHKESLGAETVAAVFE